MHDLNAYVPSLRGREQERAPLRLERLRPRPLCVEGLKAVAAASELAGGLRAAARDLRRCRAGTRAAPQLASAASSCEHVEGRTVAAAAGDLRAVAQHDDEVAVEHRLQLADAIGVDDRRA